jgi:tRNA threonylcarbamoyladenosine biosynthesis protein TsaE
MVTVISHSPQATLQLGESWAKELEPGWVIGLTGDLGVGKTLLVKGLAAGLGIAAPIQSPSFALVNQYLEGRLPLYHLDLYRLETHAQIVSAGLEEYFHPRGVTVVEWMERWQDSVSASLRQVRMEYMSETIRRITYEDFRA